MTPELLLDKGDHQKGRLTYSENQIQTVNAKFGLKNNKNGWDFNNARAQPIALS